jgi:hypothetical protein
MILGLKVALLPLSSFDTPLSGYDVVFLRLGVSNCDGLIEKSFILTALSD